MSSIAITKVLERELAKGGSLREIADRAGVNPSTLYRHRKNMERVVTTLYKQEMVRGDLLLAQAVREQESKLAHWREIVRLMADIAAGPARFKKDP